MSGRPGAFLDRDGTIIRDANYVRDPNDVELLSGAAEAIAQLNRAGVVVAVITNQSGIARGSLTHADYEAVRARLAPDPWYGSGHLQLGSIDEWTILLNAKRL